MPQYKAGYKKALRDMLWNEETVMVMDDDTKKGYLKEVKIVESKHIRKMMETLERDQSKDH